MKHIKHYQRCKECGKECRLVEYAMETPVYEPFSGLGWEAATTDVSHCCQADTTQCRTLPLTLRAKKSLLKIWNRRGNKEIINHIENELDYIGEVNE